MTVAVLQAEAGPDDRCIDALAHCKALVAVMSGASVGGAHQRGLEIAVAATALHAVRRHTICCLPPAERSLNPALPCGALVNAEASCPECGA